MPKKKRLEDLTTEEAIRRLFPRKVVNEVKSEVAPTPEPTISELPKSEPPIGEPR